MKAGSNVWNSSKLGIEQYNNLVARIRSVERRCEYGGGLEELVGVKKARKIVEDFEERKDQADKASNQKRDDACAKARSGVLFSKSADEALAVVEALEAKADKEGW